MKLHPLIPGILAACCLPSALIADPDPLRELLLPPELLVGKASELGLSQRQQDQIREMAAEAEPIHREAHDKLQAARAELLPVLQPTPIKAQEARKLFANMLEAELNLKQLHFATLVEIQNVLTDEQRKKARELLKTMPPPDPALHTAMAQRIQPKIKRIQETIRSDADAGIPPPLQIHERMEQVHQHLTKGKIAPAEAILDEILRELGLQ